MTVEAFRVLLEAMRVIIEAVRKIIETVKLFVEAVRLLVEAGRVQISQFLSILDFGIISFILHLIMLSLERSFSLLPSRKVLD